jgi:hypothetical protein
MMRKIMLVTPALAAAALVLVSAAPAFASTGVTFAVTGGNLTVSDPASASLQAVAASVTAQPVSGQLGNVTVTDDRGGTTGWTATAVSTTFTGPNGVSVPASAVSENPGTPTSTGTVTLTPAAPTDLSSAATTMTATGVAGAETATWDPTLTVELPADALAGSYTGTITDSVS